jgi:hypothetical protein
MQAILEQRIADGRSTPGARQKIDIEVKRYPASQPVGARKQAM